MVSYVVSAPSCRNNNSMSSGTESLSKKRKILMGDISKKVANAFLEPTKELEKKN
jgi:hypothetical protein